MHRSLALRWLAVAAVAAWPASSFAQGKTAGKGNVAAGDIHAAQRSAEARVVDEAGQPIDLATSGVDLVRSPPERLDDDGLAAAGENGFRVLLVGAEGEVGTEIDLVSLAESGAQLDELTGLPTTRTKCPKEIDPSLTCRTTVPIRLAIDRADKMHPASRARSLLAELGGGVAISSSGKRLALVRVLGPRESEIGAIDRFRAHLRMRLVRDRAHGAPPFGQTDAAALSLARVQIARSNAVWGECGISFGPPEQADVRVVDPPPAHLLAVGCDLGFPASGGELHARVDGHEMRVSWPSGESPRAVARRISRALDARGLASVVSDNLRIGPGALGTSDVLVRRKDGSPALVEHIIDPHCPFGTMCTPEPFSSDSTLSVCLGAVDLTDGLQHFSDVDAIAGTIEERAMLKWLDDGDPRTIDVVFIPSFATGGRIGESFIFGDHSPLANMLIEDRAGIRADNISFALAHELGHVILDVPGHADDFGADTPTRLMDSDAADASPFGPRRLTSGECARAIREAGPKAQAMLTPWPLLKLKSAPLSAGAAR